MPHFQPDQPIVLGLAGKAATGKTSTADALAPQAQMFRGASRVVWSHLFYALPLYELATIRQTIEGPLARDRMCYQIHSTLIDIFGNSPLYGAPAYEMLVEMVEEIATYPCSRDGKPRKFLQHVGTDIMREYDEDVWVKWMKRKITEENLRFEREYIDNRTEDDDTPERLFGVVVSDVRFENEAELIKSFSNGILVKLTASPEVIAERQQARDGAPINPEHAGHKSETALDLMPDDYYDIIIDTTDLTLEEQVGKIQTMIETHIGVSVNA